jgi:hypothetical protein
MFVTENRVAMGALTENYTSFAPAKYWNIQKKGEIKISFFDLRHRKWLSKSSTEGWWRVCWWRWGWWHGEGAGWGESERERENVKVTERKRQNG